LSGSLEGQFGKAKSSRSLQEFPNPFFMNMKNFTGLKVFTKVYESLTLFSFTGILASEARE